MKWLVRFAAVLAVSLLLVAFVFAAHTVYYSFAQPETAVAATSESRALAPLSLRDAESAMVGAAEEVMPSVVAVQVKQKVSIPGFRHPFADDPFFRQFFGDRFEMPEREGFNQGIGSGFVVDESGLILTNHHVVNGADEILVILENGKEIKAEVLGSDDRTDIAVLKLKEEGRYRALKMGDSDELKVGMIVLAVGTPFSRNLSQSVTMGIISALGRSGLNIEQVENLIQTDAAINPGNSGGPLVNLNGEVIGVNAAIFTGEGPSSAGNDGIGFAIPINTARQVLESIRKHGKMIHGYFGVTVQNLDDGMSDQLGLKSTRGALVSEVMKGSPADVAGIKVGDVVLEWAGKKVASASQLTAMVGGTTVGEKAKVLIFRDGKELEREVIVAERTVDVAQAEERAASGGGSVEKLGVVVKEVKGEEARQLNLPEDGCVVVTEVKPGSVAARVGLSPGVGIIEANRRRVTSIAELNAALASGKGLMLLVRDRNGQRFIAIIP